MYLFNFLLFSILTANALAENLANVTQDLQKLNNVTAIVTPLCACSNYKLDNSTCNEATRKLASDPSFNIDELCKILQKNTNVTAPADIVTPVALRIQFLGCECVVNENLTLDCQISNDSIKIYSPLPKTMEKFNSVCKSFTWDDIPEKLKPVESAKFLPTFLCIKDQKHCVSGKDLDLVLNYVANMCNCSNVTMGEVSKSCNKEAWKNNETLDIVCKSILNVKIDAHEVAKQEIIEPTTTLPTTTTQNSTTEPPATEVSTNTPDDNNATTTSTNGNQNVTSAPAPEPFKNTGNEHKEAGTVYATGTMVGLGITAFVFGTLIAVAAKMGYTRYRRRTYGVNPGRP